jgi:hypothetical protein
MFTGGDILKIEYSHETIGSGSFQCKAGEDGTLDLGGFRDADDANMVTGGGFFISQMNRVRGSFESPPIAWDMVGQDEIDKLVQMAESPVLADWTISHISGVAYVGRGKPVGDIQGNTNTAQIGLKLAFEAKLEKIS